MLKPAAAIEQVKRLHSIHLNERASFDLARQYFKGVQARPAAIPSGSPREVQVMAQSSRVNVVQIIVNSLVQSMFVSGFRARREADNADVWKIWQANRLDARQTAIHRAVFQYGVAYATVLSGKPEPVIRGKSPRSMTTLYGEDPDWPMWALERCGNGLWRLYDDEATYYVELENETDKGSFISAAEHGLGVCPVVRYLDEDDLDADDEVESADKARGGVRPPLRGQVTPTMSVQDQIDMTTFDLQVAQHFGAFRQRYIIGWTASSEEELLKAAASRIWTFKGDPDDDDGPGPGDDEPKIELGEFGQTDLKGYLESREASLRHAATLSQTPAHELTGQLINMGAEALAAAEKGRDRKVDERQTVTGESHEQVLWLSGRAKGVEVPADAQVRWKDTSAMSFAARVDGLGKMATMLEIPVEALWERVPDVSDQDLALWKQARDAGSSFQQYAELLERQAA